MWRCSLVLVLAGGLLGCRPSRESLTAGQIGCAPEEIQISGEESSAGFTQSSETWLAECQGRSFVCTKVDTSNRSTKKSYGLSDSDVSCREHLASAPDAAEAAPPEKGGESKQAAEPKAEPPPGGAGFEFGATPEAARASCEAGGHAWLSSRAAQGTCSGPAAELGFPAEVTIDFCRKRVCAITVRHRPESGWTSALAELRRTLVGKYGNPKDVIAAIPPACRSEAEFSACLERDLRMRFTWSWDSGERLNLLAGKPEQGEGDAAIRIQYVKPVGSLGADASAL